MARAKDAWMHRTARAARMALLGLAVVSLAACVERIRAHGYVPDEEDLTQITVGVDTRDTVNDVLGAPSTSGVADSSGYYYVRSSFRHFGPLAPRVVEREIVAITFDDSGVVQNIERYGLEDGRAVVLSRRVTDIESSNTGILRQLLRNIGNFGPSNLGL
ncbi:outer membrane protein assembly factor BamE [Pseudooceanicola sp.]|uniref:outer membrane protein assembly factor BamE n=1 Tax=Pseudooceanicola sp. TaxID=1914328 RepID=UPI0035C76752